MDRVPETPQSRPRGSDKRSSSAGRRTQVERREGTIRSLLDAAIDVLVEQGYAGASVQAITSRAGLSQGALFRHFPTREALMVAVGEDIGRVQLDTFQRQLDAASAEVAGGAGKVDPRARMARSLRLLRERCRSKPNQAFYELTLAARTNPALRSALEPISRRYYADIQDLARALFPDLAARLGAAFAALVDTLLAVFDGEEMHRFVVEDEAAAAARLALLEKLVDALSEHTPP